MPMLHTSTTDFRVQTNNNSSWTAGRSIDQLVYLHIKEARASACCESKFFHTHACSSLLVYTVSLRSGRRSYCRFCWASAMTAAPAAVATSIFPVVLLVAVSGASLLQLARAVPPPDHAAQGVTLSVHQGQVRTIVFYFFLFWNEDAYYSEVICGSQ